jgi:hypothetical protein
MLREDLKNITIDNLLDDNKISVRTGNCCFNAQFKSLADIIEYYENGSSFFNIRNAGRRTCLDLEILCKEYILKLENPVQIIDETPEEQQQNREYHIKSLIENDFINAIETKQIEAKDILNYLSSNQKVILEDKFKWYISTISIRTMNRLQEVGFEKFVINYLFNPDNALLEINSLGKRSLKEGIDLKEKMKSEFLQLIQLQGEDIAKINLIREKGEIMLNDFVAEFFKNNNHLPMFWILEQQLITSKNRSIDILINTFPVFPNYQFKTLEEIASIYEITRERVRQIRNDTFHSTFEITDELDGFKKTDEFVQIRQFLQRKEDWDYLLEVLQEVIFTNQESFEIQECIKKEQCNFSVVFVLQIIAYIFRDKYTLYGGLNISNQKNENAFLISKEFTDIFNFEKFIEEFANHIANNETEYDLNIDEFLSNSTCWVSVINLGKFDSIIRIVKDILLYEFHLYSNPDGLITIPATKERNPLDVVYEILQQNGSPMHLDDIFVEFKKIMPEHKYTQENNSDRLRPFLQRNEAISFRNRSSIYTLKEWKHIRTGTIRDAIVDFLTKFDLPQTADDITEYVLQHFPETNIASVRTSMYNDTQKRFSFFTDGLFGLASTEYPSEYEEIEQQEGQKKSFEQRLYDFEKFLTENDHFPFSTSDNEDETSLYRWWRIANKNTVKLTERQKAEIERINTQYADFETDKTVYEWFYHFNDFKLFVLGNRRLPSASGSEKFLCGWFHRAKDDFQNNRLTERQRLKYAELFKEIKYVER